VVERLLHISDARQRCAFGGAIPAGPGNVLAGGVRLGRLGLNRVRVDGESTLEIAHQTRIRHQIWHGDSPFIWSQIQFAVLSCSLLTAGPTATVIELLPKRNRPPFVGRRPRRGHRGLGSTRTGVPYRGSPPPPSESRGAIAATGAPPTPAPPALTGAAWALAPPV